MKKRMRMQVALISGFTMVVFQEPCRWTISPIGFYCQAGFISPYFCVQF